MESSTVTASLRVTCGTLAVGAFLSSIRARQLAGPSAIFVALGVGTGVFRLVNHIRGNGNSKLAAAVASITFFRLCTASHRQVVLSYGCLEVLLQAYWDHRCLPTLVEHAISLITTMRVAYAYLVHAEWLPPSTLKTFDYQTNIPVAHLEQFRRNIHTNELSRCATMHPDHSCRQFAVTGTLNLLSRSAQVFVPLQSLSLAAGIATKKVIEWPKVIKGVARSMMFLTGANMAPLMLSCLVPNAPHKWVALLASMLPYAVLQVEPPKRRASVLKAISCWALISLHLQAKSSRWWRRLYMATPAKHVPWSWVATAAYAACMTQILKRPHIQSHLAMQYLYGKPMTKSRNSTDSRSNPTKHNAQGDKVIPVTTP
ncbi:hypothetical protein H310_12208 [Aphanomyces invadans]|uniref:Transmembrane protein 135 N-terminal domain-containing protein n=1 Tax=Aphanomyces invadans TaxID=157072 RepID=A0A024TJS7_9STRA|nr:hypothetical protein H310_12208 [Aphanomyces invadans]ETV93856.1 hypothetical protein H310_12208 [Aphanomyces invadans]|eukprot:XP_008877416.1 hypothetical protein H310_12208 [Aphanomyces invadans]